MLSTTYYLVWYSGAIAILLYDTSYVYIFQCRLLHGGKIIVKRGVLLPRFMTNSRMMEIILNRELKSSREATKIGRGFVLRRQTKNIYPSLSKMSQTNNRFSKNIGISFLQYLFMFSENPIWAS